MTLIHLGRLEAEACTSGPSPGQKECSANSEPFAQQYLCPQQNYNDDRLQPSRKYVQLPRWRSTHDQLGSQEDDQHEYRQDGKRVLKRNEFHPPACLREASKNTPVAQTAAIRPSGRSAANALHRFIMNQRLSWNPLPGTDQAMPATSDRCLRQTRTISAR